MRWQSKDYSGAVVAALATEEPKENFVSTSDPSIKYGKKDADLRLWVDGSEMSSKDLTIKLPSDLDAQIISGVADSSLVRARQLLPRLWSADLAPRPHHLHRPLSHPWQRFSEKHTHGCSIKELPFFKAVETRLIEMSPQPLPSVPCEPPPPLPSGWDGKSGGGGSWDKK